MKWNDLSLKEKSDLMKMFIRNKVTSLDDMKDIYENNKEIYFGGNIEESKISKTLSRDQWNKLYRENKINLNQIPYKYRSWIEAENSDFRKSVSESINNFGNEYVAPALGTLLGTSALPISKAVKTIDAASKYITPGYWLSKAGHPILGTVADTGVGIIGTIEGGKQAISDFKDEKYLKGAANTLMSLSGIASLNTLNKIAKPSYRAYHAYHTIDPVGYNNPLQRGKTFLSSMLENKKYTSRKKIEESDIKKYIPQTVLNREQIAEQAREDAWSLYLGQPTRYNMYIKNPDGTYRYNLDKINEISSGTFTPIINKSSNPYNLDYVTGAGGGLTYNEIFNISDSYGIQKIKDTWDLHPFSRKTDILSNRYNNYYFTNIAPKIQNIRKKLFDKGIVGMEVNYPGHRLISKLENSTLNKLRNNPPFINIVEKADNYMKNFEAGKLLGGKPFEMITDIPFTKSMQLGKTKGYDFYIDNFSYGLPKDIIYPSNIKEFIKTGIYIPDYDFLSSYDKLQSSPIIKQVNYDIYNKSNKYKNIKK